MFDAEIIESWNEIFTNAQIQESDVQNPTEEFLVRALVAYLQKFGYNVEESDNFPPTSQARRLFLIRLAHSIDRLLKITNKSYAFFYYDLINPVPKKTSHTLEILLNYYLFCNMFKKEVFELANGRLGEYENLLNQIEDTKKENQMRKERAEQIGEEIAALSKSAPTLKAELDAMTTKKTAQDERIEKEQDILEDLNRKLSDLHTQERMLKEMIVEDEHALQLKSELNELQAKISEYNSTKKSLQIACDERMKTLKDFENDTIFKQLQVAKTALQSNLDEYTGVQEEMKQLSTEYEKLSSENRSLLKEIAKQQSELKNVEEQFKHKRQQFSEEKAKKLANIKELEALLSARQEELSNLKILNESANKQLADHVQTRIELEEACILIMSHYRPHT